MPKVPDVYEPRVQSRPIATPYANQDFRAPPAVAQGLQQLGAGAAQLGKTVEQERERARLMLVQNEENLFDRDGGKVLFDKDQGYLLREQGDALDTSTTHEALRKLRENHAAKLPEDARELFVQRTDVRLNNWTTEIERHSGRQRRAWYNSILQGQLDKAAAVVARNPGDDAMLDDQFRLAQGPLVVALQSVGAPPEKISAEMEKLRTELVSRSLDGLLTDSSASTAATAFFRAHRDEFGVNLPRFERLIGKVGVDAEADAKVAQIIGRNRRAETNFLNIPAIAEEAQAVEGTPEFKDAFRSRLSAALAMGEKAERETVGMHFDGAFSAMIKGNYKTSAIPVKERDWLQNNAPREWDALRSKEQQWADHQRAVREGRNGMSPEARSAWVAFSFDVAGNQDAWAGKTQAEFMADPLVVKLDPRHWEAAVSHVAALKGQGQGPDKNPTLPPEVNKRILGELKDAKIIKNFNPAKMDDRARDVIYYIQAYIQEKDREWRKKHRGDAPPADEYEKWINATTQKVRVLGSGIFIDDEVLQAEYATNPDYADKNANPLLAEQELEKQRAEFTKELDAQGYMASDDVLEWMLAKAYGLEWKGERPRLQRKPVAKPANTSTQTLGPQ